MVSPVLDYTMMQALHVPLRTGTALCLLGLSALGCAAHASSTLVPPSVVNRCESHAGSAPTSLRVATYNIRAARSSSLDDVLETLASLDADVIALEEVERNVDRRAPLDQAQWLGERLGLHVAFAAARREKDGDFGVALLSRLPFADVERVPLSASFAFEPRVALVGTVCAGSRSIKVVAAHSDVWSWSSAEHGEHLAELARPAVGQGVVVAGDLNAAPGERAPSALLAAGLADVVDGRHDGFTFQGMGPRRRIDYVFADAPLARAVRRVLIPESLASDHKPVVAEFDLSQFLREADLRVARD